METNNNPGGWRILLNPIVLIAFLMIIGVFALLAANMTGWDKAKLVIQMSKPEFARGLITYLFAVTTIGVAITLVVAALLGLGSGDEEQVEKRFNRGKEVLSLLLGVFGTIVGFYFGSEVSTGAAPLHVTEPLVEPTTVVEGQSVSLTAAVSGGRQPYRFAVSIDKSDLEDTESVRGDGWIIEEVPVGPVAEAGEQSVHLRVEDSAGSIWESSVDIDVTKPDDGSEVP